MAKWSPRTAMSGPRFKFVQREKLDRATQWAFAVDEGLATGVVLSCTLAGKIGVYFLEADNVTGAAGGAVPTIIPWTSLDTLGTTSDMWHIYAHGYHWIAYSYIYDSTTTKQGDSLGLLLVEHDGAGKFVSSASIDLVSPSGASIAEAEGILSSFGDTNDHFIVETTTGVAVVSKKSGTAGQQVIHLKTDGSYLDTSWFGDASASKTLSVDSGCSGRLRGTFGRIELFCSTSLSEHADSEVKLIEVDRSIEAQVTTSATKYSVDVLLTRAGYNYAMPTTVVPETGYRLITFRRLKTGKAGGDDGSLARQLYNEHYVIGYGVEAIDFTLGIADGGDGSRNRPHTMVWGRYLLTAYSSKNAATSADEAFLLIERIL